MSDNNNGKMRSPYLNGAPDMDVMIKGLEKDIFYYGKGMQAKCIQSSKKYLDYVGRTFGVSERQTIITDKFTIAEAEKPKEIKTQEEYDEMPFTERKLWDKQIDNWHKARTIVKRNLSKAYAILWALCHTGLQQKIMSDKEFQDVEPGQAAALFRIVQKICNGNSSTDNPFTNLLESWYNLFMVKGDSYDSLALYLEAFEKRSEVVDKCGGAIHTASFRDIYIKELEAREKQGTQIYDKLIKWRLKDNWVSTAADQTPPRNARDDAVKALEEQFRVYIYIKRAGPKYDYYRSNLHNNYNEGIATYPSTLPLAHNIMDHHKNMQLSNNRNSDKKDTERGQTYQQDFNTVPTPATVPDGEQGESDAPLGAPQGLEFKAGMICFKCDIERDISPRSAGMLLSQMDHRSIARR